MKVHDQWLSQYVSFLVFGDGDGVCSVGDSLQLPDDSGITLEDICNEIVLTFGSHH
jgi:hypothetical protein